MRKTFYALGIVLCFGACASQKAAPPATLAVLETAFTAGVKAATVYVQLPLCPTRKPLCSDAAVSASIKSYAAKAYTALVALRSDPQNITLMSAAEAAIEAYISVVPTQQGVTS